ncbi:hypothetical protein PRZ48_001539 [Zasmidium cellare]|uniref:AB hydrolase-1 domain-containing protein n=1 Tax=Zasmidium cellare TaxID=395010 RepID=A0ABR0F1I0_ZASCE|nr:hypothetical protein PRZ48_001539 [Zasmidium cellare]
MPLANVNGITINYLFHDPPGFKDDTSLVVLVNGLADDHTTWSAQTSAFLSAGYRILTYDHRGIGQSSKPPGPYTADLLATDLHELLKSLKIDKANFVGVSMGGMVLQSYLLTYPNNSSKFGSMEKVVLACTYAAPEEFCSRLFSLWADMAVKMSVRDVMRDVLLWAFTPSFFEERGNEVGGLEGVEMGREAYLSQLDVIRGFDTRGELEKERGFGGLEGGKVMVLAGEEDILIPVRLSRELAGRVEGCVWKTVKGCHACLWEYPDSFNSAVLDFLNGDKS